jgi:hypothetical protein
MMAEIVLAGISIRHLLVIIAVLCQESPFSLGRDSFFFIVH